MSSAGNYEGGGGHSLIYLSQAAGGPDFDGFRARGGVIVDFIVGIYLSPRPPAETMKLRPL